MPQLLFATWRLGCVYAGQSLKAEPSGLHIWPPASDLYILISVFSDLGFIFLPSQIFFLKLRYN